MSLLILYATRQGQARRIAEHLGATARTRGIQTDVVNAAEPPLGFRLSLYDQAILTASVHGGRHEPEAVKFVKANRGELEGMRAIFVSVSLSEAGAQDADRTPGARAKFAQDVQTMIDAFLKETGWHPAKVHAAAGALLYSKYNFFLKFIMKRIAKEAGGSTDTTHDHEYTDWAALDRIIDEVVEQEAPVPAGAISS